MKKILFWLVIAFFTSTQNYICIGQSLTPKVLVGEFYNINHPSFTLKFLPNKEYAVFDDSTKLFDWGKAVYNITYRNDTSFLNIIYRKAKISEKRVNNLKIRYVVWLNGDYLTIFNYKAGIGINNHIDEYDVFVRKTQSPQKAVITRPTISYIIPSNLNGVVWIAFNQADGVAPEYDSLGNAILKIPESGVLRTSLHEDVYATAIKHYHFFLKKISKSNESLKVFDKDENFDSTCCIGNTPIILVYGYNQTSRADIDNNIFKSSIKGNVMSFFIGSFKEIEENRYFTKGH